MNISLIRFNLSYYVRTLKFIGPCLAYTVFFFLNYQYKRIGIWDNCYITAVATFVLSNWIGTSFINCEDRTQQYITRLHIRNETSYHLSKIVSILLFILPFYILLNLYPVIFDFYKRSLFANEIVACIIIHFTFSLMGTAISVFFNSDLFTNKNTTIPLQALIILITVVPIKLIFKDNAFARYITYLLPPINYLTEELFSLNDTVYMMDKNFIVYILYSLGYSMILIIAYNFVIRKKNKE